MKLADVNARLGMFLLGLIVLSPVGIIMPYVFKAGSAWGEWESEELKNIVGYIPQGFKNLSSLWHPLFPDYNFSFNNVNNLAFDSLAYVFSGVIGAGFCFIVTYILLKRLSREN